MKRAATEHEVIHLTIWLLRCTSCKNEVKLKLGYNLYEFKKLYLFCERCGRNTYHEVIGHKEKGK